MEAWREPDSLLAPVFVGAHRDDQDHAYFVGSALTGAADCVPTTLVVRRTKPRNSFRFQQRTFRRMTLNVRGDVSPYVTRIRLVDAAEGTVASQAPPGRTIWEVGLLTLDVGAAVPAIGEDLAVVCLDVSLASIVEGRLQGAPQLALLRHLWIQYMRSYDPDLVVTGGQDRFDTTWWRSTEEQQEPAS